MRQGNPERREVWMVIQAEGRKLNSRWSFKDKLRREYHREVELQERLQWDVNRVKVL